jgi:hypothetical protein
MKTKALLYFSILLLLIVIASSCSDQKRRNIIGIWELVQLTDNKDTVKWYFFDGNQVVIEQNSVKFDTANYTITSNVMEYYVTCDGFIRADDPDAISASNDGKYRIDYLDNRLLKLQRIANGDGSTDASFRYLEFERSK